MMMSLLSIFDPVSSIPSMNGWSVLILYPMCYKVFFWESPSSSSVIIKYLKTGFINNVSLSKVVFLSIFLYILSMNLLGLMPYTFSPTSHFYFNISVSMTLWLGMMLFHVYKSSEKFLSHLTPMGCPLALVPFMVFIEVMSNLIRPITLSLRLMANVMSGHMILSLMSSGVAVSSILMKGALFSVLLIFMLFEFSVAFIQAYVFSSLMHLYWKESD